MQQLDTALPITNSNTDSTFLRQRKVALGLLVLLYAFNFLDRQILVILQEPIKADLGLSDGQLGLLTGFAFAIFYVLMGIPIAWWADRSSRKNVIAIALTVWSGMTALCGAAQNFTQLAAARVGVAVGEAGGSPPAHSMISDYYQPKERGRAFSIYNSGLYIGIFLGFSLGGYLAEHYSWRIAFLVVGIPGIILAAIIKVFVHEPVRGQWDGDDAAKEPMPLGRVLATLKETKAFWMIALGVSLVNFTSYGVGNFTPSYLSRSHGMSLVEVGTTMALVYGISGVMGTYFSGIIVDRLGLINRRWYLWLPGLAAALCVPFNVLAYSSGNLTVVLASIFVFHTIHCMGLSPTLAAVHGIVPPAMRALSSSVLFFALNLIGLGLGPTFVGFLSDYLTQAQGMGVAGLQNSLLITSVVGLFGAGFYFWGAAKLPKSFVENS